MKNITIYEENPIISVGDYCLCGCGKVFKAERIRYKNKCPECGSLHYLWTSASAVFHQYRMVGVTDYTLHIEKDLYSYSLDLKMECEDIDKAVKLAQEKIMDKKRIEIDFDFFRDEKLQVSVNGEFVKKKTNKMKLLSNINLKDISYALDIKEEFEKSLFNAISYMCDSDSLKQIIKALIDNPKLEVFYSSYGIRPHLYAAIDIKKLDLTKRRPHQILGITKPMLNYLLENENWYSSTDFSNAKMLAERYKGKPDIGYSLFSDITRYRLNEQLYLELIEDQKYERERLIKYLTEDIDYYQGISKPQDGLQLLYDYIRICKEMNVPFLRYPTSLKKSHDVATRNYQIKIDEIVVKKFEDAVRDETYQNLQMPVLGDYTILAPEEPDDVKEEGTNLHHCVASYISRIADKQTKILFMRHKQTPEKSLLTLEVRDGRLLQCKGLLNRAPSNKEREAVSRYVKIMHLSWNGVA